MGKQEKKTFLSLYVFDTNLLNFYSFFKQSFDVVICPINFFIIILYFVHPLSREKNHCMLAKRK